MIPIVQRLVILFGVTVVAGDDGALVIIEQVSPQIAAGIQVFYGGVFPLCVPYSPAMQHHRRLAVIAFALLFDERLEDVPATVAELMRVWYPELSPAFFLCGFLGPGLFKPDWRQIDLAKDRYLNFRSFCSQ